VLAVLTNLGEKMSDDEVDELLKAVDTSSGEINYTGNHDYGWQHYEEADEETFRSRSDDPRQLTSIGPHRTIPWTPSLGVMAFSSMSIRSHIGTT